MTDNFNRDSDLDKKGFNLAINRGSPNSSFT